MHIIRIEGPDGEVVELADIVSFCAGRSKSGENKPLPRHAPHRPEGC
ncbi:hypothetical protein [Vineibacter terrae]|nr:hypothetical protein [Vineibacter terrae]HEX2886058.1 hypothetical protein [Vineibacter terrae]